MQELALTAGVNDPMLMEGTDAESVLKPDLEHQRTSVERRLRLPPRWVLLLAAFAAAAFSAWRSVITAGASQPSIFVQTLLWPGAAIAGAVYLCAWLGWALDID